MEHEINILVVEPGRPPRPARVDNSLGTFSQLVGGELAMGCFLPHRVMLLYNEDANRQGLPPNRCNPFVNECISGTFLLCGLSDGEGFCSLSPSSFLHSNKQLQELWDRYRLIKYNYQIKRAIWLFYLLWLCTMILRRSAVLSQCIVLMPLFRCY